MQFMVLITRNPDNSTAPGAELRESEFEVVRGLYTEGTVQQIWARSNGGGAVMIVDGTSCEAIASSLEALPLLRNGFLQSPLIVPLEPYAGFGRRQ